MKKIFNVSQIMSVRNKMYDDLNLHLNCIQDEIKAMEKPNTNLVGILLDLEGDLKMAAEASRHIIDLEKCGMYVSNECIAMLLEKESEE